MNMKAILSALFVGSISGLTTYLIIKNLFEWSDKTLFRFEPLQEEVEITETETDQPLKVG